MDLKPEDFKNMTEYEKQGVLTEELDRLYENFVAEYEMSEISIVGTFTMFINALMRAYSDEEEDDEEG